MPLDYFRQDPNGPRRRGVIGDVLIMLSLGGAILLLLFSVVSFGDAGAGLSMLLLSPVVGLSILFGVAGWASGGFDSTDRWLQMHCAVLTVMTLTYIGYFARFYFSA